MVTITKVKGKNVVNTEGKTLSSRVAVEYTAHSAGDKNHGGVSVNTPGASRDQPGDKASSQQSCNNS